MDHRQRDGERPVVHLLVEDVLVVDDDREGEEDPDGHICVGEEDLLQDSVAERTALAHCGWGGERGGFRMGAAEMRSLRRRTGVCVVSA